MPDTAALQLETDRMISTRGYTEITKRNASEMLSSSTGSVLVLSVAGGWGGERKKRKKKAPIHSLPWFFFPGGFLIRLSSLCWSQAASFHGTLGFTNAVLG